MVSSPTIEAKARLPLGVLHEPTQRVDQLHLLDRGAARLHEAGGADQQGQALRAGDGDVQPLREKKKVRLRGLLSPQVATTPYA